MPGIDEKDIEMLKILRREGRITLTELGKRVNLSPASVKNRLEKLEKLGAVKGYSAVVDPAFLGNYVKILFLIKLRVEGRDIDRILQSIASSSEVQSLYRTSGRTQAVIIAEFKDMDSMKEFASRLKRSLGTTLEYIEWSVVYEAPKECWVERG
ncbi:Lrp/AsnC family transcriptional regulator [Thermococcus sp. Bubb.Bath]|uniref:Lrp/AsnC family transcriptional regulator n=1 Tax=Thermococcus sp. Bubb.Bath TaxID=1638242 RepID=UPI00143C1BCC|nr:Lrp/AsnC family transcriptional regulator [Thermococcus sp. Bubb.Bath]NJF24796.1 Lrp/AsnC family transcriptional regulator [Thermococcus sp. Bubb.Bath]